MNGSYRRRPSWAGPVILAGLFSGEPAVAEAASGPPVPPPPHSLSTEIRDALTTSLPKYLAPTSATDGESPASGQSEESNGVLSLPKLTVRTPRPLPMSSYEFLTRKGRLELARKLFPGLRGPLAFLNGGILLAMLAEKIELEKKQALSEMTKRTSLLDNARNRETDKEMGMALARPNSDWRGSSGK